MMRHLAVESVIKKLRAEIFPLFTYGANTKRYVVSGVY